MGVVPNLLAPLVDKMGKVVPPWNSFFQQFTQNAPEPNPISIPVGSVSYTTKSIGTLIIVGGTITSLTIKRGNSLAINLSSSVNPILIPMAIGDLVSATYSSPPTRIEFWEN
jgi:hypothetical protein